LIIFRITDSIIHTGEGNITINKEKKYNPFFTIALSECIRLGQTISQRIVHDQGGRIYFECREGRNDFLVALPFSNDN
jgi:nitrogen-specific signal transduction histidine kinase